MRISVLGVFALVAAAPAWSVTAPPGVPTFYCDADRPADADTVENQLNTLRLTPAAPTLANQGRWEYGQPFFPGTTTGAVTVPATLSWTGFQLTDLNVGAGVNQAIVDSAVGFQPGRQPVNNTVRYFRYRFNLAPTVDPATYQLTLSGLSADDRIVGTYLNGTQVSAAAASVLGAGATPALQWRAGANELTFAILDTISSATHFTLRAATQTTCNYRAAPAAVPAVHPVGLAMTGLLVAAGFAVGRRRQSKA